MYPLGNVVGNFYSPQGPTDITALSVGDTVLAGTTVTDGSKIRKVPLLYHPEYLMYYVSNMEFLDVIVVASNASRKASSEVNVNNHVILTESSKKGSKIGTLGASKIQVEESLNLAVTEARKEDIILIIGEGGVKYSAEILEKFKN